MSEILDNEGTGYVTGNNMAFRNKRVEAIRERRKEYNRKFRMAEAYGFKRDKLGVWRNSEYGKIIPKPVFDKINCKGLEMKVEQLLGKDIVKKYVV